MANKLLIGTRKGLIIMGKHGDDWSVESEHFEGVAVSYATRDPRNGTLWACLDHGHWGVKLHRSTDEGQTWQEIEVPKYPEGATSPPDEQKLAITSYIWIVQPAGIDEPNRIYVGTESAGLFISDDNGDSFQLVDTLWNQPSRNNWFGGGRDLAGVCSIVVDPRDSRHVTIGISVGGVYETTDGCETWTGRNKGLYAHFLPDPYADFGQDPHFMLASPSNPDVLWQQNHCGVYRSTDRGATWQDISTDDKFVYFGFALALDENDENTAWVIPAMSDIYRIPTDRALCVCRTEDGGKTWTQLRTGLPQQNAYDIVYRHALDINQHTLAFGTTAGNVYISDDRGDSWQCIAQNLAGIYSTRFA
jgi:photosystem II stability/assembly factor-like uncharacterized protein